MSPVHVIVGDDPRAEAMWASAFTGAVDLYRFDRNVDAFERLTAAEAPIDLVVLTPAQRGPFNLTPQQFIARVLEGPLGSSRFLANLHVIVVGAPVDVRHPRVMGVSTLDAAIRLVKFGEVETAPRPQPVQAPVAAAAPAPSSASRVDELLSDLPFSGSVISRIWDAPDPVEQDAAPTRVAGGGAAQAPVQPRTQPVVDTPAVIADAAAPTPLFTRVHNSGFVVGSGAAAQPATTAAEVPQVGAPGEAIEVATGALQPARPYHLEQGAGYRGPAIRGGQVQASSHEVVAHVQQPVPPALANQVQAMVYGAQVGNPNDPLLTWSSTARSQQAPAPAMAPVAAGVAPQAPMPVPMQAQMPMPQVPVQTMPIVPMEPPVGAYGAAPAQPAAPAVPADPFLARAEQGGSSISFG